VVVFSLGFAAVISVAGDRSFRWLSVPYLALAAALALWLIVPRGRLRAGASNPPVPGPS
jgi:hypothetical protein